MIVLLYFQTKMEWCKWRWNKL